MSRQPRQPDHSMVALLTIAVLMSGVFYYVAPPGPHPRPAHAAVPALVAGEAHDSAEVAQTVERFHQALEAGDSTAALQLLTPDVQVLESGGVEDLAQYRSHHLGADIEFARAVESRRTPLRVQRQGDLAWTAATSTARGTFRGREINTQGAELMVLRHTEQGWRISAIHWSSRARRP